MAINPQFKKAHAWVVKEYLKGTASYTASKQSKHDWVDGSKPTEL
jgi:hypothetical protein